MPVAQRRSHQKLYDAPLAYDYLFDIADNSFRKLTECRHGSAPLFEGIVPASFSIIHQENIVDHASRLLPLASCAAGQESFPTTKAQRHKERPKALDHESFDKLRIKLHELHEKFEEFFCRRLGLILQLHDKIISS
jgi:hypothetical protein